MKNTYSVPEFKTVKIIGEDILTSSNLDDYSTGWETGGFVPLGNVIPME